MQDQVPEFEFPEKLGFLLFESAPYKIAYGGRGSGKCLAIGTRIIMADGSLRAVEDVKPGDCVMGPDSKPRNVLGVTRGFDDMYKIHQTSGIDYTVNSAHILSLKDKYGVIHNINIKCISNNLFGWNYNNSTLSQIRIEPIGKGEYAGFSLDGDHLFLLEDGTVTHNTENGARALILLARTKRMRILCGRELQNSIADSSKFTLEANIEDLGLQDEFEITKTEIVHKETGSRFFFMGLRYNIGKVKSLGRIDIVWIDEADKLSKTTIDKLLPTIRGRSNYEDDKGGPFGNGPELWIFFNPDLDDDEIYIRSVKKKNEYFPDYVFSDDNGEVLLDETGKLAQTCDNDKYKKARYAVVQKVNYWDNKWFPPNLRTLMNVTKAQSETKYLEVWEGHTKLVLEGAIYAEELKEVLKSGRRGKVVYDPTKPVYTFWDLGHSDKTAIWFVQRVGLNYNIINFYQNNLKKIGHYLQHMQSLGYIYGTVYMPHDADNETLASRSIAKLTRDAGYKVIVVQRPARKLLGINAARTILPLCCFDEENTSEGWQCLSNYAFKVDEEKGTFSREPDHDTPWSHGADAFQTLALSLKTDQDAKKPPKSTDRGNNKILNLSRPTSWMGV